MVGESDRHSDPVAKEKAEFHEKEPTQKNIAQREGGWTYRGIRRDIVWILGILATVLLAAVRPELDHPHDYWAAAIGADWLFAAICLYLYDVLVEGRGWTLITMFIAMVLISFAIADSWTHDFRMAQLVAQKSSRPAVSTVIPEAQFQPPRFEAAVTSYVLIDAGTVTVKLGRSTLAACPPYTPDSPYSFSATFPVILTLDGLDPISVCVDNNRIFVNVQLRDERQSGPQAEIIHDHFTIEPTDWDWNSDNEAFEAVDKTQRPLLQLIYRSPSDILIHGVFIADGVAAVLADEGSSINFPLKDLPSVRARPDRQIKRIFKYPHEKYLHVRE
jgi:hypothetical protein